MALFIAYHRTRIIIIIKKRKVAGLTAYRKGCIRYIISIKFVELTLSLMKTKEHILGIDVAVINENIRNFVPENN